MPSSSSFILGTVQLGMKYGINNERGKPSLEEAEDILSLAKEEGIQILDTAEAYGNSQEIIGSFHKKSHTQFKVMTKFKNLPEKHTLSEWSERTNKKLGIDKLYALLLHDFATYSQLSSEQVQAIKSQIHCEKIGVSLYTLKELELVAQRNDIDLIQLPFNLLDSSPEKIKILESLKRNNIILHSRSCFLQGVYAMALDALPEHLHPLSQELGKLQELAMSQGLSLLELALRYNFSQPLFDGHLLGVDSVDQLKQNLKSLNAGSLSPVIQEAILKIQPANADLINPSLWPKE